MNVNDGSCKCSMSISESNQIPFLPSYLPNASLCYKMNTVRTYKTIYKLLAKQGKYIAGSQPSADGTLFVKGYKY